MNTINVCFASDNNYAKYMGLALMSILKSANKEDSLRFFVLDNNIKQEEKDNIAVLQKIKPFEISFIPINDEMLENCHFREGKITVTTYARFLVPRLIKEDKVLYLDCDIFVRKSLAPLFNVDISNYYMAGVLDFAVKKGYLLSKFKDPVLPENYLNAGVLLINNKRWREENVSDALFKYASQHSADLHYADQDCLNFILHSKVLKVNHTWNMRNHSYDPYLVNKQADKQDILEAQKDPAIRHFKPWRQNNISEFREEYVEMMKNSPWAQYAPKDDFSISFFLHAIWKYWLRYPACFLTPKFYIRIKNRGFKKVILGIVD